MAHTPGPWITTLHTGDGVTIGRTDDWTVVGADDQVVCWEGGPNDHADGNARLIAAAPEVLEALRELWVYAQGLEGIIRTGVYRSEELKDPDAWVAADDWAYNGEGACMRDQVEAAIAKATQP